MTKQQRYQQKRLNGICTECKLPAEIGRSKCKYHLDAHNKITRKGHLRNIANGKCGCGRETILGKYRCPSCTEIHKKTQIKLYAKRKENNCCIRCGTPLMERTEVTKCINCMEGALEFRW